MRVRRIAMLAKKPLTDRAIRTVKPAPAGKRRLFWDAVVPGLALRVTDTGKRTFVLVTRYPSSPHPAPRSLGTYGVITLEEARHRGREWLKLVATGIDPAMRETEQRGQTLNAISADYFARKAKDLRSRQRHEATLVRLVYPTLGTRPIDAITRSDIVRLLDRVEDDNGPMMANLVLEILGRVMAWHATRSDTFRSPIVRGMKRGRANARSRILTDDELRAIWRAANGGGVFGAFVKVLLLTAARRNEAVYARRSEISGSEWLIPASRYKTKIDHLIPLSGAALAQLPSGAGDFIFSANGKQAIGWLTGRKAALDEASGVTGWTIHDLRRTARSLMSRAGVPSDHAERALGHVIRGVRGVYDRHEYLEEKRQAFDALAALIERIVSGTQADVVPMRRGKR
jgi:integrase